MCGVLLGVIAIFVFVLVVGPQITAFDIGGGNPVDGIAEKGCEVPKADPTQVHELVERCTVEHPGYDYGWRKCVIDNPTEWMYDDTILVSTKGTCIPHAKLYELPAAEIEKIQVQYKQRNNFNNMEFVDIEIRAEFRESLKASLMNTNARCPGEKRDGDYIVCDQTCDSSSAPTLSPKPMYIDCLPVNDCVCLIR